ncbi:RNA polymerase I enhancer binding protein [Paramarasmius palmivorus]|uniref:RNA polymerase I enhancer binding protein n=1 Tax=Paramarasmius palmivorus TaxID=297713 RepID=A0AAW0E963_9AGAR
MEAFLARQQNSLPSTPPSAPNHPSTTQSKRKTRKDHGESAETPVAETSQEKKKRRRVESAWTVPEPKKKGKAKQKQVAPTTEAQDQADPLQVGGIDEEGTRFLKALVEAATVTANSTAAPEHQYLATSEPAWPGAPSIPLPEVAGPSTSAPNDMSNESVLRAIQDLDASKIAELLKALSDAQNASATADNQFPFMNAPLNPAFLASLVPPPLGQRPVSAGKILGKKQSRQTQPADSSTPQNFPTPNAEDAYILANRWLSASKLDDLARTRGLVYKKGKFSNIEDQQLESAIEQYRVVRDRGVFRTIEGLMAELQSKGLTEDQILEVIFAKDDKSKDNSFWSEITAAVPLRPIISVYHHVRRKWNPLSTQGKWTPEEDDRLRQAVGSLGLSWEKVSVFVGRRAPDCRDRWRNHLHGNDNRVVGKWTKEEEDKLTEIVQEMTVNKGGSLDDEVFWGTVSDLMGKTRNRQQCRIKWTDSLSKVVKKDGCNPRWNNQDAYILVHKLDSLNVRDDSEIDWKTLGDEDWNHWSAHTLQRRWFTMKKSIKGHEDMSFRDIMEILKAKKTNFEIPASKRKGKKGFTSAETIEEE